MNNIFKLILFYIIFYILNNFYYTEGWSNINNRNLNERCPKVKALRNFKINEMMGSWYIIQYYASSEEAPEYSCMKSMFTQSSENLMVTMNFTYIFLDDPFKEQQTGNLTWYIPNMNVPAHWIHTEDIYEGIYNTYILDTDYKSWGLIMHCAEKTKSPRYLSALMISRTPILGINVINFLREKLPVYNIDTSFMFPINQNDCDNINIDPLMASITMRPTIIKFKHPLKPKH